MVDATQLLHVALVFTVGSLWVTLVTVITERWGSVIGGVLGGLPSTSAFSFLFIGLYQSTDAAVEATTVFPLAFGVTCAFLFFYAYFAKKSFVQGIVISLIIWLAASAAIAILGINEFVLPLVGGLVISALTYVAFMKKLKLPNLRGKHKPFKPHEIVLRGVGAGALVAISLQLSQIGGPILGGIAAAFPAVFTSTIVILNHSMGTEFSRNVTKPLALSGTLTIFPFTIAVRLLFPNIGVWQGTLIAYLLVVPLAALSYYAMKH